MTGAALVSAAAVVTAAPAIVPTHDITVASAPTPLKLSTAKVELAALSDITVQGISDAYWYGWGGFLGPTDPYYPADNNVFISGASGVLYYVTDEVFDQVGAVTLDNYYFEANGLPAVLDVATNEVFGQGSLPALVADTLFNYNFNGGNPIYILNSYIVLAAEQLPTIEPIPGYPVGGGILANYYYGFADYNGYTGVPALLNYLSDAITSVLPSLSLPSVNLPTFTLPSLAASTVTPAAAATPLAAAATGDSTVSSDPSPAETTTTATEDDSTGGSAKDAAADTTTEESTDTTTEESTDTTTEESTDTTTEESTDTTTEESTDTTTEESTDTTTEESTDTTTEESAVSITKDLTDSASEDATDATSSTSTTKSATPSATTSTPKVSNPLAKLGKQIKSALSGGKKKSSSSSSSDSSGSSSKKSSTGGGAK